MTKLISAVLLSAVLATATGDIFEDLPWLGTWYPSTKPAENVTEFHTALGVPSHKFPATGPGEPVLGFVAQNDGFRDRFQRSIRVPSKGFAHIHWFYLDLEIYIADETLFDGVPVMPTYTKEGKMLKATTYIPSRGRIIRETFEVNDGELVITFEVNGVQGKRYFTGTYPRSRAAH